MVITGVVVADGRFGVLDPVTPVGDVPMVVLAVRCLLDSRLVEQVTVLVAPERAQDVADACDGLPVGVRVGLAAVAVRAHHGQRADVVTGDGSTGRDFPVRAFPAPEAVGSGSAASDVAGPDPAGIVLLHDVARPLAPPGLAVAVVDAVRSGYGGAVPVLPMSDTIKQVDATGTVVGSVDRATLRVVQTPQAIRRDLLVGSPLEAVLRLAARDPASVHTVAGHPLAFAVRSAWDLELAHLLSEQAGSSKAASSKGGS